MATSSSEFTEWKNGIVVQLQNRNKIQRDCFQDLITLHNRLFDSADALRSENLHLSIQNERLRQESGHGGAGDGRLVERVQALEQKLLGQQEELTELHRRKGENAQQLVEMNKRLQEKERQLHALEFSLSESVASNTSLKAEIQMYQNNVRELENLNQMLKDEHQALHLAFASLEEKLRKTQDENRCLLERLITYKAKDADKMNEENENFVSEGALNPTAFLIQTLGRFGKKQAKLQKELEEAAKDTRTVSPDRLKDCANPFLAMAVPTQVFVKFTTDSFYVPLIVQDAHDGEVNAVKWSPIDRVAATGGADRKVKLWDVSKETTGIELLSEGVKLSGGSRGCDWPADKGGGKAAGRRQAAGRPLFNRSRA
ncbi:autophagy-related protein 16-1-like [Bacillus rossius redtenbacheri]|uniref:autophagy-related protein 16-1-like n=1 Tax=Bacillus rossius redtenbacheri TaxID=93214 RepID=UPI002FDCE15B